MEHIRAVGLPTGPLARVLILEGVAVLSIREKGKVQVTALGGGERGALVAGAHGDLEIVHFQVWPNGDRSSVRQDEYSLNVYLRAKGPVSVQDAAGVALLFRKALRIPLVSAYVRNDAWFLDRGDCPDVPPFEPFPKVPTYGAYYSSPSASCTVRSTPPDVRCDSHSAIP